MHKGEVLELWTIYQGLKGAAGKTIGVKFEVTKGGSTSAGDICETNTIEEMRSLMENMGKVKLERNPNDDRHIVEVWL